jgi:prolyl oligopeptidase
MKISSPTMPRVQIGAVGEEILHGTAVADPYRWLEDGTSPDVQTWVARQHSLARHHLDAFDGRGALAQRLSRLFYLDSLSPPHRAGDRLFYKRYHADKEMAVLYWSDADGAAERVLIDPNTLPAGGTTSLGAWVPSYDGKTLAFALHENGADEATLHLMDVASGTVSSVDRIEDARYASPSWTPEGDGFYYTWLPADPTIAEDQRPGFAEVRFHAVGTDPSHDPVVRERTGNPETFHGARLSRDGHWLIACVSTFSRDDVYYRDLRSAESPWLTLVEGIEANFFVQAWEDRFVVVTNHDAPRWRVLNADPTRPGSDWEEIVAEDPEAVLRGATLVGGRLVLTYVRDAAGTIEIRRLDGVAERRIALPSIGSVSSVEGSPDHDEAYFEFSSFLHPPEVYRLSAETGEVNVWSKVPRPVDPSPFTLEQVRYPSKDGTLIPLFLVHRRDMALDGATPFLLTGYGGFGVSMEPAFDPTLFPWLEAGGAIAVASVRGGGEYGEEWHRAGAREHKQNTFDDFIAAGEYLISGGYTAPRRLAIQGGSNGGLLVGAALTQRPELFAAAVCADPLLDMVRYHLFGAGRTWISEYGSPEDADAFAWLYAYSPYHRVREGTCYPPVLFASSGSDDRVDPLHARKMAAALQDAGDGETPALLRIEAHAGHGGADRVRSAVETWTDIYAFLFATLGMSLSGANSTRPL